MHRKRLTLLITVALATAAGTLALAACAGMPPINLPGPLAPDTPTPSPLPTVTPSPMPTPTPTPLPIEVVHQGERDLRNGDWDAASLAFQQALADPGAAPGERAAAEIGLAHASLKRGDFTAARAALDSFLVEHPDHPQAAQAFFLRGEARLGLSDWGGAISDFQAYLALRPGLIDSYAYERIADAYLALGMPDQALPAYDQALQAGRHSTGMLQLREKVATVNRSLGSTDAAIAQYQAILQVAENDSYRATIEFYIGQALFEAGRYDEAYPQLERVFMTYPQSFEAITALRALLEAGYSVDQFQRGVVNYNQGQYDIAVEAFLNYLAATEIRLVRPDTHLYIARSYRQLGNIPSALSELQALITRFKPADGAAWGDAWLEIASIYAASGAAASAYATLEQLVTEHPELPQAADALAQAAGLAASTGDLAGASAYYERLTAAYPEDARASAGLFQVGISAYRSGDLAAAERLFNLTAGLPTTGRPAASYFWLGRTYAAAGRADEAEQAFASAQAAEPTGYYGLRAADRVAGSTPFVPPTALALPTNPDEGRAEAEQWIASTFALDVAPPLATALRGDIAADPRMARARELWDLGLVAEAKQDFEAVRAGYFNDPLASYQLAIYFREIGLYRSSILAASRLHVLANISPLEGPAFLARLRYPTYFSDLILHYAGQYGLDPLLLFALIEQESLFESFATSSASAQGLMQIWPPTGEDIAAALAWPSYTVTDLQRPYVSVAFGTWLLADEFRRFDGDAYAVLAAYNAGSGNALNWQQAAGGDPDLYVEVITLTEPQTYIRRIYEHYAVYRALYGTP
jgi:soluble lytic murein transglycosylase